MENKIVLEKAMAANNEAIKKIEKELVNSIKKENKILVHDAEKQQNEEMHEVMKSKKRRYRYHNWGFCRFKTKCRCFLPEGICEEYLEVRTCGSNDCLDRHPKACRWMETIEDCKRGSQCD